MRCYLPAFAAVLLAALLARPVAAQSSEAEAGPALQRVTASDVLKTVEASEAEVVVLNMWATWCVPCREEFPALVRLDREVEGVDVIFVSADFEEALPQARTFLKEQGVTGTTYLKDQKDNAFVRALSEEWTGALPATFIYDQERNLARFWEGKSTYSELKRRVAPLL